MHAKLAAIYAEQRALKRANKNDIPNFKSVYDHAIKKFMAIPQLVFVGQLMHSDPTITTEDYAACACAIQNFQLTAWELGLGVQWSTGPILNASETTDLLGIDPTKIKLIGALYIGYPKVIPSSSRRPYNDLTQYYD